MKYEMSNKILEELGIRKPDMKFITQHITRPIRELDRKIYRIAVEKYNR
jgi:hypothetical protein